MASRKIADLDERLQSLAVEFTQRMSEAGIPFMFTSTRRTQAEQDALYAQGRTTPGRVVTWTRKSKHIYGLAFDIAILRDNKPVWDLKVDVDENGIPDYEQAGAIGESIGLVWGGRWKSPDYPHFQLAEVT